MRRARRGGTLVAVMLVLILLSALSAAVASRAVAHTEGAVGHDAAEAARAAADAGVVQGWWGWDADARAVDTLGQTATMIVRHDDAIADVVVRRVSPRLWWITAEGWATGRGHDRPISRATGFAVWLSVGAALPTFAVTSAQAVEVAATAHVDAAPTTPGELACAPSGAFGALDVQAGTPLRAPPGSIQGSVRSSASPLPALVAWRGAADTVMARADVVWMRDTTLASPASGSGSTCVGAFAWPDSTRPPEPCARPYTVSSARGRVTLASGRHQGVLVAERPLVLRGDAEFAGVVLARDSVQLLDGARIRGTVLLLGPTGALVLADSASIRGAPCVSRAALLGGGLLTEVPRQGWYWLW